MLASTHSCSCSKLPPQQRLVRAQAVQVPRSNAPGRVLVLGGCGFIGQNISSELLKRGYKVVTISRRPCDAEFAKAAEVKCIAGDLIKDPELVQRTVASEGPFDAVVHAVGMILPNSLNALASGSGSKPAEGTTYDQVTRQTASAAADVAAAGGKKMPFVFVSAAEAGWQEDPPFTPGFLRDYLIAKRAVERKLLDMGAAGKLRPVILRPSLVWSPDRPAALPPVMAFALGHTLGIPGVDKPVRVETLARAAVQAIEDDRWTGIMRFDAMEEAAEGGAPR